MVDHDLVIIPDELFAVRARCLEIADSVDSLHYTVGVDSYSWGHEQMARAYQHFIDAYNCRLIEIRTWCEDTAIAADKTAVNAQECDLGVRDRALVLERRCDWSER